MKTSISRYWSHFVLGLGFSLVSCATPTHLQGKNSAPAPFVNSGNLETVVLLGTNDIHGALAPERHKTKDSEAREYFRGGASIFASHVRILKKEYGDRLVLLDGGDHFQGSIDSNLEEGRPMTRFFNELGYAAAVIGNHEFDFGAEKAGDPNDKRGVLKARIREANFPYLAANIVNAKTGRFPGMPEVRASTLVRAGRLKIGIVGFTTLETPTVTRRDAIGDLEFKDMEPIALAETKKLRAQGADIVVLLAHAGVFCDIPADPVRSTRTGRVKSKNDFQTGCQSGQEIPSLLRRLPPGTFDAVVSGHTHSMVHHWIEGVPVIQGGTRSQYYNLIFLTYDHSQKKLVPDLARIEGPMPICPQVFKNQGDCNGDVLPPAEGRGPLVTPELRGASVRPDPRMDSILRSTFESTAPRKAQVVGRAARAVPHLRTEESPLGNFVADAMRESAEADFALMNNGGVRAPWEPGEIRYSDVFTTLPFDNRVVRLTLSGKDLRLLMRITHSGARGYVSTSGLRVTLIRPGDEPTSSDLNGNKRIETWEMNRLLEVTHLDGTPIDDRKLYTLATVDFLVFGGDSLKWFMDRIPAERVSRLKNQTLLEATLERLRKMETLEPEGIHSVKSPLVKPSQPRLRFKSRAEMKQERRTKRAAPKRRSKR